MDDTSRFPLALENSLTAITEYNYTRITANEDEVVRTMDEFKVTEARTMIILDQGDYESWTNT